MRQCTAQLAAHHATDCLTTSISSNAAAGNRSLPGDYGALECDFTPRCHHYVWLAACRQHALLDHTATCQRLACEALSSIKATIQIATHLAIGLLIRTAVHITTGTWHSCD